MIYYLLYIMMKSDCAVLIKTSVQFDT